jgi:hypothetical protein
MGSLTATVGRSLAPYLPVELSVVGADGRGGQRELPAGQALASHTGCESRPIATIVPRLRLAGPIPDLTGAGLILYRWLNPLLEPAQRRTPGGLLIAAAVKAVIAYDADRVGENAVVSTYRAPGAGGWCAARARTVRILATVRARRIASSAGSEPVNGRRQDDPSWTVPAPVDPLRSAAPCEGRSHVSGPAVGPGAHARRDPGCSGWILRAGIGHGQRDGASGPD